MTKQKLPQAFRATWNKNLKYNYWAKDGVEGLTFKQTHTYNWPTLKKIYDYAKELGIQYIWHFYEPYVELTWMCSPAENRKLQSFIKKVTALQKVDDLKFESGFPKEGFKPDWFCNNEGEMWYGAARHALSAKMVGVIEQYRPWIDQGMGIEEQISRNIHTICNPMGLNYKDEYKICFSRGLVCFLYSYFKPKMAQWLYIKVFRQKLPK